MGWTGKWTEVELLKHSNASNERGRVAWRTVIERANIMESMKIMSSMLQTLKLFFNRTLTEASC